MTSPSRPVVEDEQDQDPFLGLAIALSVFIVLVMVFTVAMLNRGTDSGDTGAAPTTTAAPEPEETAAPTTTAAPVVEAAAVDVEVVWAPDGSVVVEGQVQSEDQKGALVNAATVAFGQVDVEDVTVDDSGGVDADNQVQSLVSIVDAMPRFLIDGEATLGADVLAVRGTLAAGFDDTSFDDLLAEAEARGLSVTSELAAPPEIGFERTYLLTSDGIVLSGTVASEEERARLVAEAQDVFGAEAVVDQLEVSDVSLTSGTVALTGSGVLGQVDALRSLGLTLGGAVVDELAVDEEATAIEDLNALFSLEPIQFDVGSATIRAESVPTIDRAAEILAGAEKARVSIEGHTDADGSEGANLALSEARAAAVLAALVERGIPADRLESVGFGESRPIADNATDEGKAANRRIEFVLL